MLAWGKSRVKNWKLSLFLFPFIRDFTDDDGGGLVWACFLKCMVCIHSEDTILFLLSLSLTHSLKKNNNACTSLPISPLPHHLLTLFGERIRSFLQREKVLQLKMEVCSILMCTSWWKSIYPRLAEDECSSQGKKKQYD